MSEHLTEDDLVLHYYGEMATADESRTAEHLDACRECRTSYTRLQRVLGSVDEATLSAIDIPPSFERTVWARLEPNLRRQRRGWISWLVMAPAPLALAATVVLLVAGAFFAGRSMSPSTVPAPGVPTAAASADPVRERILLTDLAQHLNRSQMALVELVSSEGESASSFSNERTLAEELVADNRLYRQTAEETGDTAVSDLLDEIDRVLTEIAASPEQMSAEDLAAVRHRIESRDLLFKLRVVSSALRERQKEIVRPKEGQRS